MLECPLALQMILFGPRGKREKHETGPFVPQPPSRFLGNVPHSSYILIETICATGCETLPREPGSSEGLGVVRPSL
jgi:hypothetical protein